MQAESYDALRAELEKKKAELTVRLDRITNNLRRGYHPDSKERAKEPVPLPLFGCKDMHTVGKCNSQHRRVEPMQVIDNQKIRPLLGDVLQTFDLEATKQA